MLSAAGAAALIALPAGRESEAAEADPAVVETYLAQLSETTARDPSAPTAGDREAAKNAKKADQAERILHGVYAVAR